MFGEGGARIIVSVAPEAIADWEAYLSQHMDGCWQAIGTVGQASDALQILTVDGQVVIDAAIAELALVWESAIERRLEQT